jgi:hypothetical protein
VHRYVRAVEPFNSESIDPNLADQALADAWSPTNDRAADESLSIGPAHAQSHAHTAWAEFATDWQLWPAPMLA